MTRFWQIPFIGFAFIIVLFSGCTFQPLHAPSQYQGDSTPQLRLITVSNVDSRVGQQVRNHLLFLLHGGNEPTDSQYNAKIIVTSTTASTAAKASLRDTTAGSVKVIVSYSLYNTKTTEKIASGNRFAVASFDKTSQEFANNRAIRDAQNRASKQVAEFIRIAIATDIRR